MLEYHAVAVVERLDLVQPVLGDGVGQALVTAQCIGVHVGTRDREALGQFFGGLSHRQAHHRVGQAAQQRHDQSEMRRSQLQQRTTARTDTRRLVPCPQPRHHELIEHHRVVAHCLGTTGQHQLTAARGDIQRSTLQCLHPRGAVALHGPGRNPIAAAQAQRHDTRDIGLVRSGRHTAQDELIDAVGRQADAVQQGPARGQREIAGMKR